MNLTNRYMKFCIKDALERYSFQSYCTIPEIRSAFITKHRFESVRVREMPTGNSRRKPMQSWEIRVNGKNYFFDCDPNSKTFTFTGVR